LISDLGEDVTGIVFIRSRSQQANDHGHSSSQIDEYKRFGDPRQSFRRQAIK
jgi:hypothetical protein